MGRVEKSAELRKKMALGPWAASGSASRSRAAAPPALFDGVCSAYGVLRSSLRSTRYPPESS